MTGRYGRVVDKQIVNTPGVSQTSRKKSQHPTSSRPAEFAARIYRETSCPASIGSYSTDADDVIRYCSPVNAPRLDLLLMNKINGFDGPDHAAIFKARLREETEISVIHTGTHAAISAFHINRILQLCKLLKSSSLEYVTKYED